LSAKKLLVVRARRGEHVKMFIACVRARRKSVVQRDEPVFPLLFQERKKPATTERHSVLDSARTNLASEQKQSVGAHEEKERAEERFFLASLPAALAFVGSKG